MIFLSTSCNEILKPEFQSLMAIFIVLSFSLFIMDDGQSQLLGLSDKLGKLLECIT